MAVTLPFGRRGAGSRPARLTSFRLSAAAAALVAFATEAAAAAAGVRSSVNGSRPASSQQRRLTTTFEENLCLNRPAALSSTYSVTREIPFTILTETFTGDAYRLNDGDIATDFFSGNGCAETLLQPDAWARIDFEREVPVAEVTLWTKSDAEETSLHPIELYVGNSETSFSQNILCASNVVLNRNDPVAATCVQSGRYLWIVLRRQGTSSGVLSLCEVSARPKGPAGTLHLLLMASQMFDLTLDGIGMESHDRIRIIDDDIYCGRTGTRYMDSNVLTLTSPSGERESGTNYTETWRYIQIRKAGLYKVCWCGGWGDCSQDEDFFQHVATLVVNGEMLTLAGTGAAPASALDVRNGEAATSTPLDEPSGIAVDGERVFFSEKAAHRVRYLDLRTGIVKILAGVASYPPVAGFTGDGGPANQAELASPMGIALSPDNAVLYIADSATHRVRQILVGGTETPEDSTINTVAGNGYRGFSGDGGPANEAQLSYPSAVAVDLNYFLWITDQGNNRIRVVSLDLRVLVPGTTDYISGIILTAAGNGQSGISGDIGNGNQAVLSQIGMPMAITSSKGFINSEIGVLPSSVYVAEDIPCRVRRIALDAESYLGEISNVAGSGERGSDLDEASPNSANTAMLASPNGLAVSDGMMYVSDSANNRILLLPVLEYSSLGCWREDIADPHIPSIEPGQFGYDPYLDGPPEVREDAIYKCAMATLARGYTVFALRRMGACCTSALADISYQEEGSSTSCADGRGGSRDNSVYQLLRPGMMVEQLEIVYVLSGRNGIAGYGPAEENTWNQMLSYPTGLATNPDREDLIIADSHNNRLQIIFHQVGPDAGQESTCTQGGECAMSVSGNGLFETLRAAVFPESAQCGDDGVDFMHEAIGFERNPVPPNPSPSYVTKVFSFGLTNASHSGSFRVCFCTVGANIFGNPTQCTESWSFIMESGMVFVKGPNTVTTQSARAGVKFNLVIYGGGLSRFDRIRVLRYSDSCGVLGANFSTPEVHDPPQLYDVLARDIDPQENLHGQRLHGNGSYSLWEDIIIDDPGMYRVCWCEGVMEDGLTQKTCDLAERFNFPASTIFVQGPAHYNGTVRMDFSDDLTVLGTGLGAGDRIRLVDYDRECGTIDVDDFTGSLDGGATVPDGPPNRVSPNRGLWANVKLRRSGMLKICWCGKMDGCASGEDFNIRAATLTTLGPRNIPLEKFIVRPGEMFDLAIPGAGFSGHEKIRVVDFEVACAAPSASVMSTSVNVTTAPNGNATSVSVAEDLITWTDVFVNDVGSFRVCFCPSGACAIDADFFIEAGMVFANSTAESYNGSTYLPPPSNLEPKIVARQPKMWGVVEKDDFKNITVIAKTRSSPSHGATSGRIHVQLHDNLGAPFGEVMVLEGLAAGETTMVSREQVLSLDATPSYIRVRALDSDAWFCEYIDVYVDYWGWNRFACDGWALREAMDLHREARRATDVTLASLRVSTYTPHLSVAMWETRFMQVDMCGGCQLGLACVQESQPMEDQLAWEGIVDPYNYQPSSPFRARCRPVCGDGLATVGEQCDDGNTESFDGCSGQCQVEHGFECINLDNMPSRCYPQFCDEAVRDDGVAGYTVELFDQGEDVGYMCSASLAYEHNPPPDKPFLCYPWSPTVCPVSKETVDLMSYLFKPPSNARVDCAVSEMDYEGQSLRCLGSPTAYDPPLGEVGYLSAAQCAEDCYLDLSCNSSRFYIDTADGGSECAAGLSPGVCGSHCMHLDSCVALGPNPDAGATMPSDSYHISRKLLKGPSQVGGDYACSLLQQPRPVWAQETDGNIMVQFDSKVEMPVINGETVTRGFGCDAVLTPATVVLVGGEGSLCSWVAPDAFRIVMGPEATINRIDRYDTASQLFGNPGIVKFDSTKIMPLGIPRDYWKHDDPQEFEVFVRRADPYTGRDAAEPKFPEVVLRGPELFGACGPIEVFADSSVNGGGRRWKTANWTCVESRPEYSTNPAEEELSDVQKAGYQACPDKIQPYLDEAEWCGEEEDMGVVRVCNLRASIPERLWCGLSLIKLRLTLTSAEGFSASAEWTTRLSARVPSRLPPGHAYPTLSPAGPTTIHVSPQRNPGDPLPRLTLEIRTFSDPANSVCECNQSSPLKDEDMGGVIYVDWHYGEVINGRQPKLYEMKKIHNDESDLPNVLVFPMQGRVLEPGSHWRFQARAAYPSQWAEDEGADVAFQVHVGPVEPPNVIIRAPQRACGRLCSVLVDASETQVRELLYWDGGRRMQAIAQELTYRWECRQLGVGLDDGLPRTVTEMDTLNQFCTQRTPSLMFAKDFLLDGLYLFTVEVTDSAYPSVKGRANVTVEITSDTVPGMVLLGPPPMLRRDEDAKLVVKQMGFDSCPVPNPSNGALLLLMRTVAGRMKSTMKIIATLSIYRSTTTIQSNSAFVFEGQAASHLLEPGFLYAMRLVYTDGDPAVLTAYADTLRDAGVENDPPDTERVIPTSPPDLPTGAKMLDTEPFGVYNGPAAGTLEVMQPRYLKGMAMIDIFALQQVWATDYGPLQFSFWYASVPESERATFEATVAMGFTDSNATTRLMSLVPPESFQVLTSWSLDPTISTPLPVGMYIVQGKVLDQNGNEASLAVGLEALPSRSPTQDNAYEQLEALDRYVNASRQAILQVRSVNRAAISVLTVSSAVNTMPNFTVYDWFTMTVWNVTSGIPDPTTTMRPYDTPIVSKELRDKTLAYLYEVTDILYDIVVFSDDSAFADPLSGGRRLQGSSTDTAVQAVSSALRSLAESIAPVLEPVLFVRIGDLAYKLLQRLRGARGNIAYHPGAAQDLMSTLAALLANTRAARMPREGNVVLNPEAPVRDSSVDAVLYVNITATWEAQLSDRITKTMEQLADAISAWIGIEESAELSAELPPGTMPEGSYHGGGALQLTVLLRSLADMEQYGVGLLPNYQQVDRWPYPRVLINPLGFPGFDLENWAGSYTTTYNPQCYDETEAFSERIATVLVSWPFNPVRYSSGSLVGIDTNVSNVYTVQLRSCGEAIVVDDMPGKVEVSIRMPPSVVRDRRWGFHGNTPYRVAWWEDIEGLGGATSQRIRRWTTQGCRTDWVITQEDLVNGVCDRLPQREVGSLFAIELVPRPPYLVQPPAVVNASFHNIITYAVILLIIRWTTNMYRANHGDRTFWPSEKNRIRIHFVPADLKWRMVLAAKKVEPYDPDARYIWKGAFWAAQQRNLLKMLQGFVQGLQALSGDVRMMSVEVHELRCMRDGRRDEVYENHLDAKDDREAKKRSEDIVAALEAPPEALLAALPEPHEGWPDQQELEIGEDTGYVYEEEPPMLDNNEEIEQPAVEDEEPVGPEVIEPSQQQIDAEAPDGPSAEAGEDYQGDGPEADYQEPAPQEYEYEPAQEAPRRREVQDLNMIEARNDEIAERDEEVDMTVLPDNWEKAYSLEYNMPYYFNKVTLQTMWEFPTQERIEASNVRKLRPTGKLGTLRHTAQNMNQLRPPDRTMDSESQVRSPSKMHRDGLHQAAPPLSCGQAVPARGGGDVVLQLQDVESTPRRPMMRRLRDPQHWAPPPPLSSRSNRSPPASGRSSRSRISSAPRYAWGEGGASSSTDVCAHPRNLQRALRAESWHAAPPEDRSVGRWDDESNLDSWDEEEEEEDEAAFVARRVESNMQLMHGSQDVTLPIGWEVHRSTSGHRFYVNQYAGITQWNLPQLPPHWEERMGGNGRVYYLRLSDGHTQWEWPHEPGWNSSLAALTMAPSGQGAPGQTSGLLALPGCPETALVEMPHGDTLSEASTGTSGGAAGVDAMDPMVLLALPRIPIPGPAASVTPGASPLPSERAKPEEPEKKKPIKWGVNPKEAEWLELKKQLHAQRKAHDQRFKAAHTFPGVRSFVRPHEMEDQMNNWERQLNNVLMKRDQWERRNLALGHRSELRKEELRNLFPVVQRLQWTKWSGGQIFYHALRRSAPSQRMFLNVYPSPKRCRCLMDIFTVSVVLLCSMIALVEQAPVDEEVHAVDRAPWTLLSEVFSPPWENKTFIFAGVAAVLGRWVRLATRSVFFAYEVPMFRPPPQALAARREQMRYWHDLAETGKWVCLIGAILCCGASLALCALSPQPRASMAFRIFFVAITVTHAVGPLVSASVCAFILTQARTSAMFDPLLSVIPGIMDFMSVGVVTPEFFAWRCQRIVSEEEMMAEVHGRGKYMG